MGLTSHDGWCDKCQSSGDVHDPDKHRANLASAHAQEDTHVSQQTYEALTSVLGAIIDGEYDDALDRLSAAVSERRRLVSAQTARKNVLTIMPGAKVKLQGLSPKYLNGLTGTVIETPEFRKNRRRATLSVNLDYGVGRFGKVVHVPASCLTPID